jgi:ABC-type phosphate transport system substrate-binding protein
MAAHAGKTIDIPEAVGSGGGLDALTKVSAAPTADMAASSKIPDYTANPTGSQRNYWNTTVGDYGCADLRIWAIGKDSIAIIVSETNPAYAAIQKVANASMISDLFCNNAMNGGSPIYPTWNSFLNAIGATPLATDHAINVHTRVFDSGTHDGFKTFFLPQGAKQTNLATGSLNNVRNDSSIRLDVTKWAENQQVVDAVSADSYALGYVGLGFLEDNPTILNGLWIGTGNPAANFVEPTKANVYAGLYKYDGVATTTPTPIYRWLWYATNGVPNKDSQGALKASFISFVKMHPEYINQAGYLRMWRSDFTGTAATPFAAQDSGALHPSLPDDKVDSNEVAYFVDAYIAYWGSSHLINPYCDFNGDGRVDSSDVASFVDGYIAYWSHNGP